MRRRVSTYIIGIVAVATLAGCGRSMMQFAAERAAWRSEAEADCMKSGAIKEGAAVVRIEPIEGPGMCGADFPLKVAALGEGGAYGYTEELRPPGSVPRASVAQPRWPIVEPRYAAPSSQVVTPAPRYVPVDPVDPTGGPLSLTAPGGPPAAPPRNYEPIMTRPAARAPDYAPQYPAPRAPQYAPPSIRPSADDIPDDAIVPDRNRVMQRPSMAPAIRPLPALGPAVTGSTKAAVSPAATLACPMVSALNQWITGAVQPAAMRWFRQPVVEIKQISAYSCRGMVGSGTNHISEHAFGNALDIAAFVLADGSRVTVKNGWDGTPEEVGFLHDVQLAACERFTTVLAPGYNAVHHDHIHVDLMRRASGRRSCKPYAMSGEVAAAKQLQKNRYASRHGDPQFTSSVAAKPKAKAAVPGEDGDFGDDEDVGPTGSIAKMPAKTPAMKLKPQPMIAGDDGDFDDE